MKTFNISARADEEVVEKYRCINQKPESSLWVWAVTWKPVYISHYSGTLVPDLQHGQLDLGTVVALLADLQDDVNDLGVVTPDLYACFVLLANTVTV